MKILQVGNSQWFYIFKFVCILFRGNSFLKMLGSMEFLCPAVVVKLALFYFLKKLAICFFGMSGAGGASLFFSLIATALQTIRGIPWFVVKPSSPNRYLNFESSTRRERSRIEAERRRGGTKKFEFLDIDNLFRSIGSKKYVRPIGGAAGRKNTRK